MRIDEMKAFIAFFAVALACVAHAGSIVVHIKMPDGKVLQFEDAKVSSPNRDGFFHFRVDGRSIWVHCSNVWFTKK